ETQLGIDNHPAFGRMRVEADRSWATGAVAKGEGCAVCGGDLEAPRANDATQDCSKQQVHRPHPSTAPATPPTQSIGIGAVTIRPASRSLAECRSDRRQ